MNDAPRTPDPGRRRGVERRATRALVTNYIHELSDRHGGRERRQTQDEAEAPRNLGEAQGG
jgi:hypothetical protein